LIPATGSSSFINSDYVKWLEASGARVVPVHYNASHQDLLSLFSHINGLVYPGGDDILNRTQYYYAAKLLFDAAVEANKMGDVFPLWGTCLGFQFLNVAVYGSVDILSRFDAENISLPLTFTNASPSSQLWSHASPYTINYLSTRNVTENVHHFGVAPDDFLRSPALSRFYDILSTSVDRQGLLFLFY
jgi:gamma-glutamyl hydrolase